MHGAGIRTLFGRDRVQGKGPQVLETRDPESLGRPEDQEGPGCRRTGHRAGMSAWWAYLEHHRDQLPRASASSPEARASASSHLRPERAHGLRQGSAEVR